MSREAIAQTQPEALPTAKDPGGILQRKCDCGQHTGGGVCTECGREKQRLQRHPGNDGQIADVHPALDVVSRSTGWPMDAASRTFMESRFGQDFSQVRIHTDAEANESAHSLNALAYTVGHDVVFAAGQYAPDTSAGRHLLAHELTHVLQQRSTHQQEQTKLAISHPADTSEREADRVADAVVCGTGTVPSSFAGGQPAIQRACKPAGIGTPACSDDTQGPTFVSGHGPFKFLIECDDFDTGEEGRLRTSAAALPASGPIEIHGYASTDGDPIFNRHLSCARALKAESVLSGPGGVGIASGRITTISHGPTPGPAAERRSVVIQAAAPAPTPPTPVPPPLPLTVAFSNIQANSSPTGMPDRIPPRVDTTVGVGVVGFTPPMAPITLSIDGVGGGNGAATINGAATFDITGTTTVQLRGTTQTSVGNAGSLRLVANQGPTRLAASNTFSVSSVPQNWSMSFLRLVTGASRGIVVQDRWESDSGVVADLDQTEISELVETKRSGGSQAGAGQVVSGFLPGDTFTSDTHSTPVVRSTGFSVKSQVSIFNDRRTGATDVPMTNSGYSIGRFILPVPGSGFLGLFQDFNITTMKFGSNETAQGVTSAAGRGSVSRTQRM